MGNQQAKENIMANTPIKSLIIKMALPLLFSFLVEALYVLVDSYFISKLSMDSFSGMGLGAPVYSGICAIGAGIGIGVNVNISKALGEGNNHKIKSFVSNGLFLALLGGISIAIIGAFVKPFFAFQTDNTVIISEGLKYLLPLTTLSFAIIAEMVLMFLLTSSGKTHLAATASIVGTIANVILDPIFMFRFGWGILGASVATVLSFIISALLCLYFNINKNKEITLGFTKPSLHYIAQITKIGAPTFLTRILYPITALVANYVFVKFSMDALNVFTVQGRFESLTLAPIFAVNSALTSIIAFNLGAKSYNRVNDTIKFGLIYANIVTMLGFAVYMFWWWQMLALFGSTPAMFEIGRYGILLISSNFIILGIRVAGTAILQAMGKPNTAMLLLMLRQVFIVIPLLFVALAIRNLHLAYSVWIISEVPSAILTLLAISKYKNKLEVGV